MAARACTQCKTQASRRPAGPVTSFAPVTLAVPGRHVDLQLKVTAPAAGPACPTRRPRANGWSGQFITDRP